MAGDPENGGVKVEDFYAEKALGGKGFFQRITFPPGCCSEETTYTHPYIVYPLTSGTLSIEIGGGKVEQERLEIGTVYVRHASPEKPISVRVCNHTDYPIIILKG